MRVPASARLRRLQSQLVRGVLALAPAPADPGVTILIAYYRTPDLIETCLKNIRQHSSSLLRRVIVIDNASGDGVGKTLGGGIVDWMELPLNCGHGQALDYGSRHVETKYLVSLDSDAWPVADNWLEELVGALDGGATVAGVYHHRGYIHPSCLAIATKTFRRYRLSFEPHLPERAGEDDRLGRDRWDVGERISMVVRARGGNLRKLRADRPQDPDRKMLGATYGGLVFHLWYGTRVLVEGDRPAFDDISRETIEAERARQIRTS